MQATFRPPAELFALAVLSWALGLGAYALALFVCFREFVGHEIITVAVWSGVVWWPLLPAVYLPAVWLARQLLGRDDRRLMALLGAALAPVAQAAFESWWAGRLRFPSVSPETLLFGVLFCIAGAVFTAWAAE